MKIAVCISGIPRSGIGAHQLVNQDFQRNFNNLRKNFPNADFFMGTWRQYENTLKKVFPGQPYWLFDEPVAHYHPYLDMKSEDMISDIMRKFAGIFRKRKNNHERTKHQAKQILCHANMVNNLPEKYDVIIRTRFDTFTCADANFDEYVNDVYQNKGVIGFASLKPHFKTFNVPFYLDKNIPEQNEWLDRFIFDQIIIHHGDNIDTKHIFELYKNKKLCPAEFGWYQVLSQPYNDNHKCVSGWANADRYVLPQFLVAK